MDVIVYTPEEWEVVREGPFGETVLREGRVLYEAGRGIRPRGSHRRRPASYAHAATVSRIRSHDTSHNIGGRGEASASSK
jgi:hypothetical protein